MNYKFACGCQFRQLGSVVKDCDKLPPLEIDYYNLPNCPDVWPLLGSGKTKGVFQLEKSLGKHWCKELYPESVNHIAALTAILRPGCISGDTKILNKIRINSKGTRCFDRTPIATMFKNKNFYKNLVSLNEKTGEFIENKILNIVYSGKKECFRLEASRYITHSKYHKKYDQKNNILECTDDHKIFTSEGWKELKDLKVGDRIAFLKKKNWTNNIKDLVGSRHHKGVKIKNTRGMFGYSEVCNKHYEYKCIMCDWQDSKLDVNHIEGNRHTNNSPENLCFFCPNHHRMFTEGKIDKETIIKNREKHKLLNPKDIFWLFYLGKKSVGVKDTYDISVEGPNHNFIAGNTVVHNCLESIIDDKSLTQHYCDNKNQKQETKIIHPALKVILEDTYQMLIYQEQVLLIAKEMAGFTGIQADTLRRGIGHKDAKVVFEMEKQFIDGCARIGTINEQDARMIFDIIKKSNRYLFNKSHSVGYGTIGYWTSYTKHHFPLHFYAAYIAHAKDKQDPKEEIKELIDDARNFGISIIPPHISSLKNNNNGDVTIEDSKILFGIIDIKGIGQKQIEKMYNSILEKEIAIGKDIKSWSWNDFLFNINASSTVVNNLVLVGATPGGVPRKQKAYEYSIYQNLTARELEWFSNNYKDYENFGEALSKYSEIEKKDGGPSNIKRKAFIEDSAQSLKNSPYSTKDHPDWIVANERELIGIPITYSSTENKMINTGMTCSDFIAGKRGKINILVEISSFKEYTIKKGANAGLLMCVLELKDSTDSITGIMFHEDYKNNQEYLFDGNVIIVSGFKSKKDPNCLIINKVQQV